MELLENNPSRAPQFIGVIGVAFLLILAIIGVSLTIRRSLPRKASRDAERGRATEAEVAPLLPEPIPGTSGTDDYQQAASYGAAAVLPSPADKRDYLHQAEATKEGEQGKDRLQHEWRFGSNAGTSDSSDAQETPTGPYLSANAHTSDYLEGAGDDLKQPSRPYSLAESDSSAHTE